MVLMGSTNIAPPPEILRTTVIPCLAAPSGSTSLRSDWKLPMTTAGEAHSHTRRVGARRPAATSAVRTSSSAMCRAGACGPTCTNCQSKSLHSVAWASARRTATPTPSAVSPSMTADSGSAAVIRAARPAASVEEGAPSSAPLIEWIASSGSRKKSPATRTSRSTPSRTSRSTTTSLPPGTLYSPCTASVPFPCARRDPSLLLAIRKYAHIHRLAP